MISKLIFKLSFLIALSQCSLHYPECSNYYNKTTILQSLKGKIQGACNEVTVDYGGYKSNLKKNVLTWLSVPYAQAPIGNLRFKNPVPVKTWKDTLDGTEWPYRCVQMGDNKIDDYSSEDCLYLNIFVPYEVYHKSVMQKKDSFRAPIYIWVHGGSNINGAGIDYDSSTLAAMSDIIVVTINYRLGPFGFFTILDTEAKGNQGFLDQSLAFKWVFENAHLFGGDKTKIAIGGESAGAWDVGFHLLYKPSWPYFSKAIMQSGTPADIGSHLRTPEEASKFSVSVAEKLGCNINKTQALLTCLQSMSTESFYSTSFKEFDKFVDLFMPLVLDPDVFSKQPRKLIENGDFKKCDLLVGYNTLEGITFIDREFINMTKLKKKLAYNPGNLKYDFKKYYQKYNLTKKAEFFNKIIDLYGLNSKKAKDDFYLDYVDIITDECYRCPSYLFAEQYSKFEQNAYVYLYGHKLSTSDWGPEDGAVHG